MNFLRVYDTHYQVVKKFILMITKDDWAADDLIQEPFILVKKNIKSVRNTDKISSWIFKIAYHLCMDHLTHRNRETLHPVENEASESNILPLKKIEQQQMSDCIQEKMERLPGPSTCQTITVNIYFNNIRSSLRTWPCF